MSMDWFKGKSSPETMGFFPSNIGFSGSNFPIIKNSVSWWFQPSHLEKKVDDDSQCADD
jgi:hypothetical protein